MMKMMMRRMMNSEDSHDRMDTMDNMDDMDMFSKMFKSMKSNKYDSYKSDNYSPLMKRFMVGRRLSFFVQSYYFLISRADTRRDRLVTPLNSTTASRRSSRT